MKGLWMVLLVMSSSVFASSNNYDLKMELSLNGKHASTGHVLVKEGTPATIIQENGSEKQFIEVIATEGDVQNHKGIMMTFTIGTIGQNGKRIIVSKPKILTKEGERAKITQGDLNGKENLSLVVTANRTTL